MEFLKLWRTFVKRFWLILLSALAFFVAAVIFTHVVPPTYEATAKLLVDTSGAHSSLMTVLGLQDNKSIADNSEHDTDIALATIRPLLEQVISTLNLKSRLGKTMEADKLIKSGIINKVWPQPYLEVEQVEDADLLEVNSVSKSPEEAEKMSNLLADLYVSNTVAVIRQEYGVIRAFLQDRIKAVEKEYTDTLTALQKFRTDKDTVDLTSEAQRVTELRDQLDQLVMNLASKSVDVSKQHPDYKIIQKQMEQLSDVIGKEVRELPAKQAEYSRLSLKQSAASYNYERLLQYQTQVALAESITLSNTRIVERAAVPTERKFPKKLLMYVLGVLLGGFFGLGVGFFVEYVDAAAKAEKKPAAGTASAI